MNGILHGRYGGRSGFLKNPIKVLTWNIERGLNLRGAIEFVSRLQPDLCLKN
jgi:hypothetical protein